MPTTNYYDEITPEDLREFIDAYEIPYEHIVSSAENLKEQRREHPLTKLDETDLNFYEAYIAKDYERLRKMLRDYKQDNVFIVGGVNWEIKEIRIEIFRRMCDDVYNYCRVKSLLKLM